MVAYLKTNHLRCEVEGKTILDNINLIVERGEFIGILGPNGCGKSTLLHHIIGLLPISEGEVILNGKAIQEYSYKQLAKEIAVVNQKQTIPFEFTVHEVVEMGRFPHKSLLSRDNKKDSEIVENSLLSMGMLDQYYSNFYHLSGGQQQRVLIAKALAQDTPIIILDEPTNHLDIEYQIQVFDILKQLNKTVLTALHDLNIASMYCDRVYLLKEKQCRFSGIPHDVLNEQNLYDIFGVKSHIYQEPFAISYQL